MAELTSKLVRDYFKGSWSGKVFINGEFTNEIIFTWTEESEQYSVPNVKLDWKIMTDKLNIGEKVNRIISVWRSEKRSWINMWYNESGGYSEQQWTSQEEVNGVTVLYGSLCERITDGGLPTEHIAMCELKNKNNFKYTILSYRKGILEMVAKRNETPDEMNKIAEKQVEKANT